jgi:tetratricopeptide (TPR) repeat protein
MAKDNLAKELALHGNYDAAISLFRQVLERKPGFWLANFNLGYVYYKSGKLPEAERHLKKAIEISPLDPAEHRFLGYTLLESGRPAEAEISLKQAIKLNPNAPNQHYALGTILKERGDLDGALVEFQQELKVNPKHLQVRQDIADVEAAIRVRKK